MADTFRISIDDAKVRRLLNEAPAGVQVTLRQLIEGSAIDIQREMRIAAPVAVTGDLRRSVRYTYTPALLQAEILPDITYAEDVESGTKPHYVSVAEGTPLRAWAKQKGINPYALRNSIARKGTKAHPFVQPTYEKMRPQVIADITEGINRLVTEMNG